MKKYSFTYRFDDSEWVTYLYANSEEEAKRKFWALKENGQYSGQIVYEVEVPAPNWLVKLVKKIFKK